MNTAFFQIFNETSKMVSPFASPTYFAKKHSSIPHLILGLNVPYISYQKV